MEFRPLSGREEYVVQVRRPLTIVGELHTHLAPMRTGFVRLLVRDVRGDRGVQVVARLRNCQIATNEATTAP
jgi:hypothetical protein